MLDCDCQQLTAAAPCEGVLLSAASKHVWRQLTRYFAQRPGVVVEQRAVRVGAAALPQLEGLLAALSFSERAEVRVAPYGEGGVAFWNVQPLEDWLHRQASPWFHEVYGQLHFDLQPVVNLRDASVFGYEALVCAFHGGQRLGAGRLLAAARAHGELRAFDAQARLQAISQAYPCLQSDEALLINFTPGVVYNPQVCLRTTFAACDAVGADFSRLVFEVTESEAFPDLAMLRAILEEYRARGARVALDDLGAGYTSVLFLRELLPDIVKLDRGLISGLREHDPRAALVGALIGYAHSLGSAVVAEGIETPEELVTVARLGADYGQGYLLGRPRPGRQGPDLTALRAAGLAPPEPSL